MGGLLSSNFVHQMCHQGEGGWGRGVSLVPTLSTRCATRGEGEEGRGEGEGGGGFVLSSNFVHQMYHQGGGGGGGGVLSSNFVHQMCHQGEGGEGGLGGSKARFCPKFWQAISP